MLHFVPWLLFSLSFATGRHFNGGTITWAPIDPYSNASSVPITITQTYSWTMPNIRCATNVPISTSGWGSANDNLTCVVDCSTDGGYSAKPIDILTDCISSSSSLNMMTSQRSRNVTLAAGAHFSIAYQGVAWRSIGSPAVGGLDWSILSSIDLRRRPDGFINTPPVATVVSPQYVVVNQPTQIKIPVSDANSGDNVRCRWSTFTSGYRRRRRAQAYDETASEKSNPIMFFDLDSERETVSRRSKRDTKSCSDSDCQTRCEEDCRCSCSICQGTSCSGSKCESSVCRPRTTTTTRTTTTRTTATTTPTTSIGTTSETIGTKKSTSSFPIRQAIDECGGICYPKATPSGTTLSNCTVSLTGLVAGAWYAISVQVEDFINSTSMEPMSSVPVQFLIQVLPAPQCSSPPILSLSEMCMEVQVGVSISFDILAINQCGSNIIVADIVVAVNIPGILPGNITQAPDESYATVGYTWTPLSSQLGPQTFCTVAFTR